MSEHSLKQKTIKGVSWSIIDNISYQSVTFIVGIILARLLSPSEYGLIGIITIFISISNTIVESGFTSALIRKTKVTNTDYCTIFYLNIFFSFVLYLLLYFLSPFISSYFNQPELELLTKVLSITVIINAFSIIQTVILSKNIDFKTKAKISFISSLFSGIVGIYIAYSGGGVWALVAQQISRQLLYTLLSWIYTKWYPSFLFSLKSFKELFGYSWKLLASALIETIWRETYQLVIGKCYSPDLLGQYTRANGFTSLFSSNLTGVIQRVSFPVFSAIQDDLIRLKTAYARTIKITMLVTFSAMLGLAAIARPMVLVLLGEKWLPCVPFIQILSFYMMLYPLHSLNLNILQVQGRSDLFLKLEVIKKIIAIVPVILGIYINIYWMLIGSVVVGVISYYINAFYTGPFLNYSIKDQVKDISKSFIISLIMFIIVLSLSYIPLQPLILLIIQILSGIFIVVGLCEYSRLDEYMDLKEIICTHFKRK